MKKENFYEQSWLSRFLIVRGFMLVLLEETFIRFAGASTLLTANFFLQPFLFWMMTLGPLITLLCEIAKGRLANVLSTFGKVPMFYYLLHIPLIHVSAIIVNLIRTGQAHHEWYTSAPFTFIDE